MFHNPMTTELMKRDTLTEFCAQYDQAERDIDAAFELLQRAADRIDPLIRYAKVVKGWSNSDIGHQRELARTQLRRDTWREIASRMTLREAMAPRRRREFDEQLERGELPPISVDAILSFIANAADEFPQMIAESIEAAAKLLRPHNEHFKTNGDGWKLGEKAITEYGVQFLSYSKQFELSYYRDADIISIDNAFHLLDGKGPSRHPQDLATAMRTAMREGRQECQTEYFEIKWFKKGTVHWRFKRMDLVDGLNARAAEHFHLRQPAEAVS